jgi:hypothetical protein
MKKHVHRIAKYTALILISSMPFSMELKADTEIEKNLMIVVADTDEDSSDVKRKLIPELD